MNISELGIDENIMSNRKIFKVTDDISTLDTSFLTTAGFKIGMSEEETPCSAELLQTGLRRAVMTALYTYGPF